MLMTLALISSALGCHTGPAAVASAQPSVGVKSIVFDGVTVIDVERGTRIPAQRVVIVGNRIQAVGNVGAIRVPSGAQVVDARGKYLIPGLWDLHTHSERSANIFYPLFIANGVTGIRDAGSPVPLDTLIMWRREILAGTRVGPPRQILSGQAIAGPQQGCERSKMRNSTETCIADTADARHYVDSLHAAGADMIKPRDVTREMYFVIAAEARRLGIPFGGHAQSETPIEVSDSGASIVDHSQYRMGNNGLNGLCWAGAKSASVEKCQPVAERFKRNGTWFVPTLVVYLAVSGTGVETKSWNSRAVSIRFKERARAFWSGSVLHGNWFRDSSSAPYSSSHPGSPADSLGNMRIMQSVGLPIMAGTDVNNVFNKDVLVEFPPGFALHAELAIFTAEGMTPLETLRAATLNPAIFLHATDSLGTVAPGKLADLVLLDADPLVDITNTTTIRAVVANGRYFDRAALDQLLIDVQTQGRTRGFHRGIPPVKP